MFKYADGEYVLHLPNDAILRRIIELSIEFFAKNYMEVRKGVDAAKVLRAHRSCKVGMVHFNHYHCAFLHISNFVLLCGVKASGGGANAIATRKS